MGLEIIAATPAMADDWGFIHAQSWQQAYKGIVPDSFLATVTPKSRAERFRRRAGAAGVEDYLVCVNGEAAGLVSLRMCGDGSEAGIGEVGAIYFLEEYWGRGYAKQAMDFCLQKLREQGFCTAVVWVLKDNTRARRFYEKCGFAPDGAEETIEIGAPLQGMRYRRGLGEV